MSEETGLRVVTSRKIVSPAITWAFDFFLATAWPYRLMQCFGVRWVWRPRWLEELCWRLFERLSKSDRKAALTPALSQREREEEGSTLLIVAEKPEKPV